LNRKRTTFSAKFTIYAIIVSLLLIAANSYYSYNDKKELYANILKSFKENSVQILYKAKDGIVAFETNRIKHIGEEIDTFLHIDDKKIYEERVEIFLKSSIISSGEIVAISIHKKGESVLARKNKEGVIFSKDQNEISKLGHLKKITVNSKYDNQTRIALYYGAFENTQQIQNIFSHSAKGYNYLQSILYEKMESDFRTNLLIFFIITILLASATSYTFFRMERFIRKSSDELEKAHDELQESFEIINENIPISFTDKEGVITKATKALCNRVGYSEKELIGNSHKILKHRINQDGVYAELWSTILNKKVWNGEMAVLSKNGETIWYKSKIYPRLDKNGEILEFLALREDITDKKLVEQLSYIDPLTGIYNRRKFNEVYEVELRASKRGKTGLVLAMVDIDYFKSFNDTYGHIKGDEALSKVANVIKENLKRARDYCFRVGGEEFAILLEEDDKDKAKEYLDNIRKEVLNLCIPHQKGSESGCVTISIGFELYNPNVMNVDGMELYSMADNALYKAKNLGRNRVVYNDEII